MMSGIRNAPPISISSPRDTRTGLPFASVWRARSSAAAQLLTTSASSASVRAARISSARLDRLPRLPVSRSTSRSEYPAAARVTARTAASASGARPRFVCSTTPVALITGVSPNVAAAARSIARARISSSSGGSMPRAAPALTSASVDVSVRFRTARPTVFDARIAGAERSRASTDGSLRRTSRAMAGAYRGKMPHTDGRHGRPSRLPELRGDEPRPGRRRRHHPGRRLRHRGDDPQHRSAASLDARGAPDHRRAGRRGDRRAPSR